MFNTLIEPQPQASFSPAWSFACILRLCGLSSASKQQTCGIPRGPKNACDKPCGWRVNRGNRGGLETRLPLINVFSIINTRLYLVDSAAHGNT